VTPYLGSQFVHRPSRMIGVVLGISLGTALFVVLTTLGSAFLRASALPLQGVAADLVLTRPMGDAGMKPETTTVRGPRLPFGNQVFLPADLQTVAAVPGVTSWAGGLEVWDFGDTSYRVVLGVDPSQDRVGPMVGLTSGLLSGRVLRPGDQQAAMVDRHFAAFFGLKPGDEVIVGTEKFLLVGVSEQKESSQAGVANLYIPLDQAERLAGAPAGEVNQVYARLSDASRTEAVVKELNRRLGPLSAISQQSILQVMGGLSKVTSQFSTAAGFLGALAGLALAWAALSGLMAERRREIGVMKAVGWRARDIVGNFLAEASLLSLAGGLLGILLGTGLALGLSGLPVPLPAVGQSLPGLSAVPTSKSTTTLPVELSPLLMGVALAISLVGGTLTGWYEARKVAGWKTAVVLRDV